MLGMSEGFHMKLEACSLIRLIVIAFYESVNAAEGFLSLSLFYDNGNDFRASVGLDVDSLSSFLTSITSRVISFPSVDCFARVTT